MLDGEEYLDSDLETTGSKDDPFNLNNTGISSYKNFDIDSESVLQEDEQNIRKTFNSKTIPEYQNLNMFALHTTFLQYVEALKIIKEDGQNKNSMNNFKIAKELFDKDLELVKRSQAIEQKIYYNLSKNIRDILQNSMEDVFEIIKKYSLDNLDKQAYLDVWNTTREQIFNQLKEQILKQKVDTKDKKATQVDKK